MDKKLGTGAFGDLYQGINVRTNEHVAIKLESTRKAEQFLQYEANLYGKLQGLEGVSNLHWFGV